MRLSLNKGFTLIELLVVIAIIGVLTTVLTMNFNKARQAARDDARMAGLKELQLAIELYKSQYGKYPDRGCVGASGATTWSGPGPYPASNGANNTDCADWIIGLVPDFIEELPTDPNQEFDNNMGYLYATNGDSYKVMVYRSVETKRVEDYDNEFARCPKDFGSSWCGVVPQSDAYAVYSVGAEDW